MDKDFKKQEKRIELVFPKEISDISKRYEKLELYQVFLEKTYICL